jgi:hypothetical protein
MSLRSFQRGRNPGDELDAVCLPLIVVQDKAKQLLSRWDIVDLPSSFNPSEIHLRLFGPTDLQLRLSVEGQGVEGLLGIKVVTDLDLSNGLGHV